MNFVGATLQGDEMLSNDPSQMVALSFVVSVFADGRVAIEGTPQSPREPTMDDLFDLGGRWQRDITVQMTAKALEESQQESFARMMSSVRSTLPKDNGVDAPLPPKEIHAKPVGRAVKPGYKKND
jgi:hypothetical protein